MKLALTLAALAMSVLLLLRCSPQSRLPAEQAIPTGTAADDFIPTPLVGDTASPDRSEIAHRPSSPPLAPAADGRAASPGEVRIEVRDSQGFPVAARAILRDPDRHKVVHATLDVPPTGTAMVRGLPQVQFIAVIDPQSLPEGYLPPWAQDEAIRYARDGLYAREYTAPAPGETLDVPLRVFRRATVSGYLPGPAGDGVPGAVVMLGSRLPGFQSLRPHAETGAGGYFEMPEVYPGPYRTQVSMAPDHAHIFTRRPLPVALDVQPDDAVSLTLQLGGAGDDGVVEGVVVDEVGRPLPGISVWCAYSARPDEIVPGENLPGINDLLAATVTNDLGHYRLEELPRRLVLIAIGVNNFDFGDPWDGELGDLPRPFKVDLAIAPSPFTASTTVAKRNTGYRLLAEVRLDPHWGAAHDISHANALEVTVQLEGSKPERIRLWGGRFRWGTMQPEAKATVLVREPRSGVQKSLELVPRPSVQESLVISFP